LGRSLPLWDKADKEWWNRRLDTLPKSTVTIEKKESDFDDKDSQGFIGRVQR